MTESPPEEFLPMPPHQFEILLSLAAEPMHGYRIIRDIRDRTRGGIDPSTSTLYSGIRRLLRGGLVEEAGDHQDGTSSGPPRRYYRVTQQGLAVARAEAHRLQEVARVAADRLLDPQAPPR